MVNSVSDTGDVIDVEGLTVSFGDFTAVDGISFHVGKGEIFGLLGPNGAGKTTTIRTVTTLQSRFGGRISVCGMDVTDDKQGIRSRLGLVQQQISLDKDISVRENIYCHAVLHKVPKDVIGRRMEAVTDALSLRPFLNHTVVSLSGGWRRKVAIACALMHDPELLFLDEPTAGLDTQSRYMLWDMIRQLNHAGTTIILTTHYIEEAENLCGHVAIMNHGRIVADGDPQDLCDDLGHFCVAYDSEQGCRLFRYFRDRASARSFADSLGDTDHNIRRTTLEDVFLELTGRGPAVNFIKAVKE